ncbi:DUF4747 family protein [Altericroceibacterium spongiae]|uniref:DUF4747 family protein n=1 Tax=Altericroceibacterium spongiae TaxID=2320269 RepID=A0A420ES27_9SPHN|nr:DUF4747 family protein [Altericroceibacterium spongiae]RKF23430.1 DUF4747 family protein [Altericroceibacterium spongiae]
MARKIKISAGVLNIRLHPHTPERYAEFLHDVYKLKKPVKLRGDRHAMISLLNRSEADDGIFTGVITTFLDIDFDGTWFNTAELKEATDEQVSKVTIPENLHPNSAQFYFQFDANKHKLYFQTYSSGKVLSEKSALSLFQGLSDDLGISQKYGDAKITVIQSKEGLAKIFAIPVIKEIKITIVKPNADIFADDFEAQIEAHLAGAHSKKLTISYEAESGSSVTPTDEIKAISAVALENGNVKVNGRDDSGAVKRSTDDHPMQYQDKYDPDAMSENQAFRSIIPQGNAEGD